MNRRTFLSSTMLAGLFAWLPGKAKAVQEMEKYPYEFPYVSPDLAKPPINQQYMWEADFEHIAKYFTKWARTFPFTTSESKNKELVMDYFKNSGMIPKIPDYYHFTFKSMMQPCSTTKIPQQMIMITVQLRGDHFERKILLILHDVYNNPTVHSKIYLIRKDITEVSGDLIYVK